MFLCRDIATDNQLFFTFKKKVLNLVWLRHRLGVRNIKYICVVVGKAVFSFLIWIYVHILIFLNIISFLVIFLCSFAFDYRLGCFGLAILWFYTCGHVAEQRAMATHFFLSLSYIILFWLNSPFHSERLISFEKEFTFYTWRLFYLFAHRSQLSHYLLSHHLANAKWMALFEFFFYLNLPVLKRISWRGDSSICWNNL